MRLGTHPKRDYEFRSSGKEGDSCEWLISLALVFPSVTRKLKVSTSGSTLMTGELISTPKEIPIFVKRRVGFLTNL
jgi:hypothetical protein